MKENFQAIIFVLCLLISVSGCDAIYRMLQKEGAEERDLIGEVIPFESNPEVEEIQKLLKLYGYGPGTPDGKIGHNTRLAIEKFQADNDLKITRFVDYATWDALNMFGESGLVVGGDIDLKTVQKALKNAGFSPGKVDGKPGPQTDRAIRKFQDAMDLRVDGTIGFQTLKELQDFLPEEDL